MFFNPAYIQSVQKDNVKYYNSDSIPLTSGWIKFKNGIKRPGTRVHYMLENEKKSLCGFFKLWDLEMQYVIFMAADQFPETQQCEVCAKKLSGTINAMDVTQMVCNN